MEQKVSALSTNIDRIVNSLEQSSQQGPRRGSFGNSSGYGVSHGGVGQPYSGQPLRSQGQGQAQGSQQQTVSFAHVENGQSKVPAVEADFGGFGGSGGSGYGGKGRSWNNGGGSDQQPICYMCGSRTKNGELDPNCKHTTIDKCPLTQELTLLGVCHRNEEGKICKGPIEPGKEGTRIFFNNSAGRMWEQIIGQMSGGPFDYDFSKRQENIERLTRQAQEGEAARKTGVVNIPGLSASVQVFSGKMDLNAHNEDLVDNHGAPLSLDVYYDQHTPWYDEVTLSTNPATVRGSRVDRRATLRRRQEERRRRIYLKL